MNTIAAMFAEIARVAVLSAEQLAGYAFACAVAHAVREYHYPIEDGCVENLDYETHARGKNWIAFVRPNRAAPGGLDRAFWKHRSKRWHAAPRALRAGDVIEMAGDYYTGRGSKRADRRYLLVVRVEADHFAGHMISTTAPSARAIETARRECGMA